MRDILFKAKRKDNGEWVEGWLFKTQEHTYIAYDRQFDDDLFFSPKNIFIPIDENTICQYTGLTDKNGNKIWENDIVKQSFYKILGNEIESEEISGCEIGVVVIIPTKGTCMKNPLQYVEVNGEIEKNFEKTKMYKGVCQYRCEVIGNIFDNPELIGE